jgi:general secretion pathway protein N
VKRTVWLIVFGVLVFAGIIVARLPASWVMPGPKSGIACVEVDGSIWSGACMGLTYQQQPVGDLSWELHAMRLLAAKINADIEVTRPKGSIKANVETGLNKKIEARDLLVDMPIDAALAAALPPNFRGLRGKINAQLPFVRIEGQVVKAIQGNVEIDDLTDGTQQWGSYVVEFPPPTAGVPVGQLRDLGSGPLAVEGSLKLTPAPGFDLEGLVAARPSAPADLVQNLRFLGSPDAQGRRPFSLESDF